MRVALCDSPEERVGGQRDGLRAKGEGLGGKGTERYLYDLVVGCEWCGC